MRISEFPESVGKLVRRKGEMRAGEVVGVIYTLDKRLRTNKKYLPLVNTQFRVLKQGDSFSVYIGNDVFRGFNHVAEAPAMINSAFDAQLVRAGKEDAGPRSNVPEDMSMFKNPRSQGR